MLGSPLILLMIVWAVVTVVFFSLLIWKTFAGQREDDQIFLDAAEEGLAAEQREIVAKVERIGNFVKGFGFASVALLLAIAGLWIYQSLMTLRHPPMP